jgi:hypothetical protein
MKLQLGMVHGGVCELTVDTPAIKAEIDSSRIAAIVTNLDLLFNMDFFLHVS